jgi:molybdenum cofactor biosynthesis enzyme MoaA
LPLFIAVNTGCNLRCWYCTESGENRFPGGGRLSAPRLLQILEVAYASGVRRFRFTGGEPTQRSKLPGILEATQALGEDVRISLTTNGAHLDRLVEPLTTLREPQVFLSVDGIQPGRTAGGGEFQIEKWLTPRLAALIENLRPRVKVRLNYVLTASSSDQLPSLIDFAVAHELDLKIFELLLRDFYYAGHRPRLEVFKEQYVPVRRLLPELRERFGQPRRFHGTGGRGIPMWAFHTASSRIIYFDSSEGSHYGKVCEECPLFPCQEGLYALVLDANGTLHPAGCQNTRLRSHLGIADRESLSAAFAGLQRVIANARLQRVVPAFIKEPSALA